MDNKDAISLANVKASPTIPQWIIGPKGDTGEPAGFGSITAEVDSEVGTPSVIVTTSGTPEALNIDFSFHNLKGETGTQDVMSVNGKTGDVVLSASDVGALPDDTPIPVVETLTNADILSAWNNA